MNKLPNWKKVKDKDMPKAESLLCDIEDNYAVACGRFLSRNPSKDRVWMLAGNNKISALLINSRSTLMPVFCGSMDIPAPAFLKGIFRVKKIHSAQGIKEEVIIMERMLESMGKVNIDIFDYDLMSLDTLPFIKTKLNNLENLIIRVPKMTDLNAIAPLQAGYEMEEVLPRGSVFNSAASRANLTDIITNKKALVAELDRKLVGKINVSAVSFTRYLVGGVYVHPDYRGKGIARRMTEVFISSLINEGKGVTLFVKKNNIAAQRLYLGLGFKIKGDYRITYY